MSGVRVLSTRADLRLALAGLPPPGLVPTMGALHAGHISLVTRSVRENPFTVVTVFVNPSQFGEASDFERYPRSIDRDVGIAGAAGADLVFAPPVDEVYPPGFATGVEVEAVAERWEGAARPGHFRGVATVVAVLFGLVRPGRAYFGEKDYQQLHVIRRMHTDLALSGEVVDCPTVRESDGLALSSRNGRLSPASRLLAAAIPASLRAMREAVAAGEDSIERVRQVGLRTLAKPGIDLDYLAVVAPSSLEPLAAISPGARALVAATIDGVRLIDTLDVTDGGDAWAS